MSNPTTPALQLWRVRAHVLCARGGGANCDPISLIGGGTAPQRDKAPSTEAVRQCKQPSLSRLHMCMHSGIPICFLRDCTNRFRLFPSFLFNISSECWTLLWRFGICHTNQQPDAIDIHPVKKVSFCAWLCVGL